MIATFHTGLISKVANLIVSLFMGLIAGCWCVQSVSAQAYQPVAPSVLHSLPGLMVLGGDIPAELERTDLSKELLIAGVDSVLRYRGMTVLDEIAWVDAEGSPVFFLDVTVKPGIQGAIEYSVRAEVQEYVEASDPSSYQVLWTATDRGRLDRRNLSSLRTAAHRLAARFMDAYVTVQN